MDSNIAATVCFKTPRNPVPLPKPQTDDKPPEGLLHEQEYHKINLDLSITKFL